MKANLNQTELAGGIAGRARNGMRGQNGMRCVPFFSLHGHRAGSVFPAFFLACLALVLSPLSPQNAPESPVFGIWENGSRFLEFSPENGMRVVLKPYYAFVYEDAGWIPCAVSDAAAGTNASAAAASVGTNADGTGAEGEGVFRFSVRYPGDRTPAVFSAAVLSLPGTEAAQGFFTRFFVRARTEPALIAEELAVTGTSGGAASDTAVSEVSDSGASGTAQSPEERLAGFWISGGSGEDVKLYRSAPKDEFFCLYFSGQRYYRIRYWRTDARFRDVQAEFSPDAANPSLRLSVPKFLYVDGFLYTCITGTGTRLRNYERGGWEISGGTLTLTADEIVFAGAKKSEGLPFRFSSDGGVLALGAPYLLRSAVSNLDSEIAAHNAKRRPPREPPLELMDLDFRWDEIEELRR